ncbi:hypothetical protein M5689_021255 [Euphorbia peplus]|nr:hypothetical protein M5689_021255 [Euphorbia peplus]
MPKKKSSKTSMVAEEAVAIEPTKPSSTPKKASKEIDDIFAGKKRKKPEKETEEESKKSKSVKKKNTKKSKESEEGRFTDPPSRSRKKTEDGFTVYTEEELGIKSNGGGTKLCPFDCDCCF